MYSIKQRRKVKINSKPLRMADVRLLDRELEAYATLYRTRMNGMSEAVNCFLPLREHTLREIRGIFTRAEIEGLTIFIGCHPVTDPLIMVRRDTLIQHIVDSVDRYNLEIKHGVDYEDLLFKVDRLSAAQAYFLQSEIFRYWINNKGKKLKFDEFIDSLL
jgi:hypothetical protein